MAEQDPRRRVPRTDALLADPRLAEATGRLSPAEVKRVVAQSQRLAREGALRPDEVAGHAASRLPPRAASLRPVLNATGVVVHTNLGRAPLSRPAVEAMVAAAGYTDVELDLTSGRRGGRGTAALAALRSAVPVAGDVHVVNNGAAALLLAVTALAAGREVLVSRGELVEIGDGFRLPDLMTSTGVVLREVGTTNRTHLRDYAEAVGPRTAAIVKVHPSNFQVTGFTGGVGVTDLATLGPPVVVDIGSGLLAPDPALPSEPDATTALTAGAAVVTASGDKLLGGPQAGLLVGDRDVIAGLRRHPLARALRVDKLTLAALEATLRGSPPPVTTYRTADEDTLLARTRTLAERVGGLVRRHDGLVGGGGAPGTVLPGWAVALPPGLAAPLRSGDPAVVGRTESGRLLLDLRCVPPEADDVVAEAVLTAVSAAPDREG